MEFLKISCITANHVDSENTSMNLPDSVTLKYIGLVKDPLGIGFFLMHNFIAIAYTSYLENTSLEQWFMEIFFFFKSHYLVPNSSEKPTSWVAIEISVVDTSFPEF